MEAVNKKIIIISVIIALFTSFLVYLYIRNATQKPEVVEYINVYVAAKTLPAKHKITDSDLMQVQMTKEYLNPKAVLNKAEIVGKRLKDSVIEGEQILKDRLADSGGYTMAYSLPEGKRAVSINVNELVNVSNLVRPGDFVDVIASFEQEEFEDASSRIIYPRTTKIILQNVQILAMGQDQAINTEKVAEAPKTVTLAVTPVEAEKLVYASEYAVLRLILRAVEDDEIVNTEGAIRKDFQTDKGVRILPK